jgi:hypothetical protein
MDMVGISYLKSFIAVKDLGSAFYWLRAFVSLKRGWGNASDAIGDERPIEGTISHLCGLIFISRDKVVRYEWSEVEHIKSWLKRECIAS